MAETKTATVETNVVPGTEVIEYETVSGEAMNRLFNADDNPGAEPAAPITPPETPPAYNANPSPAGHPHPAAPQPTPTLPSASTGGDSS